MTSIQTSGSDASQNTSVSSAHETLKAEFGGIGEADLLHINIDVVAAVTTALGVLPKLRAMRTEIDALPGFDGSLIDKLESYAMALYETHADYLSATQPIEPLSKVVEEATTVRDTLYADVQALVQRGLIDAQEIREVRTQTGYKALAVDLTLLTDAMQRHWGDVEGKTAVQTEELLHAQQLATNLLRVVGEREQAPAVLADAANQRARAFVLFTRAYDAARRAVTYLRWQEGDASVFAPSLYAGRTTGKRKGEPETTGPGTSPTPSGGTPVTAPPVVTSPIPSPPANVQPTGFPQSNPFTQA